MALVLDPDFFSPSSSVPEKSLTRALNVFNIFVLKPKEEVKEDQILFFQSVRNEVKRILTKPKPIKWMFCLKVTLYKDLNCNSRSHLPVSFNSKAKIILPSDDIDKKIDDSQRCLESDFEIFIKSGSGWILESIDYLQVKLADFNPLSPKSYIPTPKLLDVKKAIVNVRNKDNKCFKWAVLASLHPMAKNPSRVSHYRRYDTELNFGNISFPVKLKDIDTFEILNSISINVFGYDKEVFPLRISHLQGVKHHVDLLLLKSGTKSHYCLIKNFNKLMRSFVTKHKCRTFFCRFCLQHFVNERLLEEHSELCRQHKCQKVSMPTEDEIISFTQYKKMTRAPFTIYFDIECLVSSPAADGSRKHEPCAYCFVVVDENGRVYENKIHAYRGPDPITHFLKTLLSKANEQREILTLNLPLKMTPHDEEKFQKTTKCELCGLPLGSDKVRDHCHWTGKYRFALHSKCNLLYTKTNYIPVISHNLKGYDSHLIMQQLGKFRPNIRCIAKTIETYLSFVVYLGKNTHLRFIDSLQFLNGSLENLVKILTNSNWNFPILNQFYDAHHLPLLTRKGIFPYEYLDDVDKMNDEKLPPIDKFYSSLTLETISQEDYDHAQNLWQQCNISNLGEYLDLYLKTDVLLLAEVFQSFRKTCYDNFQLDPSHFISTPGLTWQAFLKYTRSKIKPFSDIDMHLFVESGIRGGVSSTGNIRYAKANDRRSQDFDSSKPPSSILYLDKNNLYGGAMREPMPVSNFRFLSKEEIAKFNITSIEKTSRKGYILEVDLTYPPELHDIHNMYPMAPERISITYQMLSQHSRNKLRNLNLPLFTKNNVKLVANLGNKRNYVCHYRNLQFYLKKGLRLERIHKILEFDQEDFIRPYVDFNTSKRRDSKSAIERDFYKLCNNALYGKTLENVRNRIKVDLVTKERKARKLINSTAFVNYKIFSNNLVAVHSHIKNVKLDKPIFIGFTVLELSKLFMYEFLYDVIIPHFGNRVDLLMTDTDSFVFHIRSDDALSEIKTYLASEFDLSNFPPDHPVYSDENKGVVNKMKVEYPNDVISEMVALRPKTYSIKFDKDDKEKHVAKGVARAVTDHELRFNMYKDSLFNTSVYTHDMSRIQSRSHQISTLKYSKISLTSFDDKRYYNDPEGVRSLAHFHTKCNE